ncbi:hypothetical protein LCGC14_0325910 [marine sediment metagenome]|uniref:Tyr recombinase domain-containing protein n=1 Tax=marine sediment metagenome TaxID=412755 RepID=A0A0F9THW7_9ZZZZ
MKRPPEVYTQNEIDRLMGACSQDAPTGIRNRALIGLLYRTGLRIDEALSLRARDVDSAAGQVTVRHGKGGKFRVVGIDTAALALLARWLDRRREIGLNGHQPIFCTLQGGKLAGQYIRTLLPRLGARAGIEKRIHAHGFRHTLAAELLREGVDIGIISKQLGHESIAVTARYLDHIAPQRVVDVISRREWDGGSEGEKRAAASADSWIGLGRLAG